MPASTRDKFLDASAELLRRQGYNGTGVKQIAQAAGAPFGSLYHFFPGGKEELSAEVVRRSGATYGQLLPLIFDPAPDLPSAVRTFFAGAAEHLEDSGWIDACPIATVALETASTSEPLRLACAEVFESWVADAAARFAAGGLAAGAARRLAVAMVCSLEGAFVLARAAQSREPLHAAGEVAAAAVEAAL